jgi:hypothetical protein
VRLQLQDSDVSGSEDDLCLNKVGRSLLRN